MFNAITRSAVYVLDQDEALDFYAGMRGSGEHPAPAPDCAQWPWPLQACVGS